MSNNTKMDVLDNPLLQAWNTPYGLPPFNQVTPDHFVPAFEQAMGIHTAELDAIATSALEPSFENSIASFDKFGGLLTRISLLREFKFGGKVCSSRKGTS